MRLLHKVGFLSEVIFWLQVHKGVFWKINFVMQRIIEKYIVYFYAQDKILMMKWYDYKNILLKNLFIIF